MSLPLPSRRRARAVLATVAAALLALLLAGALAACQPALTPARLDERVHGTSLDAFRSWWTAEQAALHRVPRTTIEAWVRSGDARLDDRASRSGPWDLSTDVCSSGPDAGPGFDFRWPCIRHDLAWRNLRRLDRGTGAIATRAQRLRANERFRLDLAASCQDRRTVPRAACRLVAAAYGRAVDLAA